MAFWQMQAYAIHTWPEKFKNATVTAYFVFVFGKTRSAKSHVYRDVDCQSHFALTTMQSRGFKIPPV